MSNPIQPRYVPLPYQDALESGRLILRDGTTARIRLAGPEDRDALRLFFERLSPESKYRRLFAVSAPSPGLIASLCDSSDPDSALTLLVTRTRHGESRIIATGSYLAKDGKTAEVAFAVDDAFQGRGLGALLLERLALLAVARGFTHFWAVTQLDNQAMCNVFRESGFPVQEKPDRGELEIDLSVTPSETSVARMEMRDRLATIASIRPFFRPNAVALVGASRDPASIGHRLLKALSQTGFHGPIYPVNPHAAEIDGYRVYSSVRDLPEQVDLAIVAVPRNAALSVVDDCAAMGVRSLVVISAGFAEVGAEGQELQKKLADRVRGHGMRMIGPNCLGLLNTDPNVQLNATFGSLFPPPGRVALSSQSGALGLAVLAAARRLHLGLSTFVSVGNKADVSGNDLLQYWEEDANTDVVLLYLESFGNPRRFARIARRVGQRKPIVALKSGRTGAGRRAAGSHTAALTTSETAVETLFRQSGVIRADTMEEMFDLALALSCQPLPRGRRVAIVTNAGGPGILCADACEEGNLVVPELSATVKAQLATFLPQTASLGNPVDLIASASPLQYRQAIRTAMNSGEADALIVIHIPVDPNTTEDCISAALGGIAEARQAGATAMPVFFCRMSEQDPRMPLELGSERIPAYPFPEDAARVLGKLAEYADWRAQPPGVIPDFGDLNLRTAREVCRNALADRGAGWLSPEEVRTVFNAMRLPLLPGGVARTANDAAELARRIGFPVAVKLISSSLTHKTEVGGVHLHLTDADAVRQAFAAIRHRLEQEHQLAAMEGVLVQPMMSGGTEVMVGMTHDPLFGPLIAFGLGGIHVEILGDVCFRAAPLTDRDAAGMVRGIRGYRLFQGYRGHPPADIPALEELLLRVSRLAEEIPEIVELDLNPVFALPPGEGCRIVDARLRVERSA